MRKFKYFQIKLMPRYWYWQIWLSRGWAGLRNYISEVRCCRPLNKIRLEVPIRFTRMSGSASHELEQTSNFATRVPSFQGSAEATLQKEERTDSKKSRTEQVQRRLQAERRERPGLWTDWRQELRDNSKWKVKPIIVLIHLASIPTQSSGS